MPDTDAECHDCHHPIRLHVRSGQYIGACEECNALVPCECARTILVRDALVRAQSMIQAPSAQSTLSGFNVMSDLKDLRRN